MVAPFADKLDVISSLCRKHRVKALWLFGSAARPDYDPRRSDLDFLVEFHPHPRKGFDDVYFCLKDDLEAALGQPVDLVEWNAVTNPYFRKDVEQSRVMLYAA